MESRIQDALQYLEQFPAAKIATVAREFGVPRSRLRRRLAGRPPKKGRPATNTKLSATEERALCHHIDRLDRINLAVRPEFVTDAANCILRERTPLAHRGHPPVVGLNWTTRFLRRHNYGKRLQKKLHSDRQASEDLSRVAEYFQKLSHVYQEEGILSEDIWNMDETGFRIGVGKDQLIVTKRKRAHYFGIPENRESATAIEAISAGGEYIPAFLIVAGQVHMAQWYAQPELNPDTAIRPTPSGYTNDQVGLEWLEHFDKHTAKKRVGKKRLLILDGHGSHHTKEFIAYCDAHDIVPFGLPPNLTHLLQPLDVVVFQPLKHYHAKALDVMVRDGLVNITKIEFLSCIEEVRRQAFKESTILTSFKKTGIWPFNPQSVLKILEERQAKKTPSPPSSTGGLHSSPFSTPLTLRQMNKVADKLEDFLEEDQHLDPEFAHDIGRFIRGSLISATELLQTKRDLGRTQYAQRVQKQRRAMKNSPLQSGGVLTVAGAGHMVRQREEDAVAKARRMVQAADEKAIKVVKRVIFEAAKVARKWRMSGKLKPAVVYESGLFPRALKRF
ncbi:DDE superfamily endonuclease [Pochonia chlamydosporia 170]|uniref:DDE superfamily endonuclease n=1 Tax=Pochonia chlamydosporia 170 TaxID=1380566 RepID=A0A179EWJ3_METCM|nr:DDE superfamily endonuclease [Pochonia chlamydosporia 170]OAQ57289.2 DDE superfamily endonuclease [Pochonia chlamydosporia 170]